MLATPPWGPGRKERRKGETRGAECGPCFPREKDEEKRDTRTDFSISRKKGPSFHFSFLSPSPLFLQQKGN